jgi:hypothetical protein
MHGGHDIDYHENEPVVIKDEKSSKQEEQLNKAMKAPIDQDRIRKAGW